MYFKKSIQYIYIYQKVFTASYTTGFKYQFDMEMKWHFIRLYSSHCHVIKRMNSKTSATLTACWRKARLFLAFQMPHIVACQITWLHLFFVLPEIWWSNCSYSWAGSAGITKFTFNQLKIAFKIWEAISQLRNKWFLVSKLLPHKEHAFTIF